MDPFLLRFMAGAATRTSSSFHSVPPAISNAIDGSVDNNGDDKGQEEQNEDTVDLVVTADDLGICAARNRGILEAMKRGVVTHTSLIANGAAAMDGLELMAAAGLLHRVGLHLNLTEGCPLSRPQDVPSLLLRLPSTISSSSSSSSSSKDHSGRLLGHFLGKAGFIAACAAGEVRGEEAAAEAGAQLDFFRAATGGREPSHVDGHQHCHVNPAIAPALAKVLVGVRPPGAPGDNGQRGADASDPANSQNGAACRRIRIPLEGGYGDDDKDDKDDKDDEDHEDHDHDGDYGEDHSDGCVSAAARIPFCSSCLAVQSMCLSARGAYESAFNASSVDGEPEPSSSSSSSSSSVSSSSSSADSRIPDVFIGCSLCGFDFGRSSDDGDDYTARILQSIDLQIAIHRRRHRARVAQGQPAPPRLLIEMMCHPGLSYVGGILSGGASYESPVGLLGDGDGWKRLQREGGFGGSRGKRPRRPRPDVGGWDDFNEDATAREGELRALCSRRLRDGLRERGVRLCRPSPPPRQRKKKKRRRERRTGNARQRRTKKMRELRKQQEQQSAESLGPHAPEVG